MGSCFAGSSTLKAFVHWLRGCGLLLKLIGLPALLALHLAGEFYGSSKPASLVLHRLSRHLRFRSLSLLTKDHDRMNDKLSYFGGADVMDSAPRHQRITRKRSMTLGTDKERSGAGSPSFDPTLAQHSDASDTASTTSTLSQPSPNPSMPSHARSKSQADIVRQGKRLSLQFPIQPSNGSNSPTFSPRSRPQSWIGAPSPVASPDVASSPTEGNLLAFIAAQERYVLELKEELVKAEKDLKTLKHHWATHESSKQRNEMRKVTQLQPLNTSLANGRADQEDEDGSSLWMQKEMDRRKALLSSTKTSQRKVFSGSRHLRTLSLLSPDKNYSPSFPQPLDIREDDNEPSKRPPPLTRNSTSPDIANLIANNVDGERYDVAGLQGLQRDVLLRTGKRMASDFKDGLLTFIEDIRQATVGDEAAIGAEGSGQPSARGPSSKNNRKVSDGRPSLSRAASSRRSNPAKGDDIADDFWKSHGLSEPKEGTTSKKTHATKLRTPQKHSQKDDDFEDNWDSWDTPNDKYSEKTAPASNSSDESEEPSPVSGRSSARTSTRYHSKRHDSKASSLTTISSAGPDDAAALRDTKRNSIPWPDLVKLSPGNLKRTASHLMKEWEKNLTPPPESRDGSHSSGDYVGRSASPAGLP
ncbi:hypothetical protein BDV96DRAFT_578375 [Lophiotrema nucula]|uniref:DUF4048 domain-containing protein n=1 Tax=Lophiotrema nucula TaxID=690887 RepID=A0A6A5Z313_9PLEO|nr:hypothetical protein BDV96DRAFT_578375 [Lophiotrema nucula]